MALPFWWPAMKWPWSKPAPPAKPLALGTDAVEREPDHSPRGKAMAMHRDTVRRATSAPPQAPQPQSWEEAFPVAPRPAGVPSGAQMAMDYAAVEDTWGSFGAAWGSGGLFGDGVRWLGFQYLAELAQRSEYRQISAVRAQEMTRKWMELTYADEDAAEDEKLAKIDACMREMRVRDHFRKAAEHDGLYGGAQIYIDTGATDNTAELSKPLLINPAKIKKGSLKGFRVIEPFWSYPNRYETLDPLKGDFYRPHQWYVQGKIVHATRLLHFISAEVPDILKPAYSFRGVSMTQRAKPYVDNWLRTRQSVSDITHSFSIVVLMTNLSAQLGGADWDSIFQRVDGFNLARDNRGTFIVDKNDEDLKNVSAPLGTLDKLQAQAQEQMAAVAQTPLVKLLGITPSGLNASSDGEIRVFYDNIHALQEHIFNDPLKTVIDVIQLHLFGEIDPKVGFRFIPLWQMDPAAEASIKKTNADTAAIWMQEGVISPEEQRRVLANDKASPYAGLDPEDLPEPPEAEQPQENDTQDPAKSAESKEEERSGV